MAAVVLSIGCDPELLEDRYLLMREAGIRAISVLGMGGFKDLRLPLQVDAVVIGSEIAPAERAQIREWSRANAPNARMISLRKAGEPAESSDDYCISSEEHPHWIRMLAAEFGTLRPGLEKVERSYALGTPELRNGLTEIYRHLQADSPKWYSEELRNRLRAVLHLLEQGQGSNDPD